ncbi:hypothetical protein AAFP35_22145 [Gordonia sp. CPCC 206044]|uniref:hypothetical protein n=1 Tax=Gordonia sp. CPCC 206044 TaxID=3140793 RepID=UPI003AF3BDAB
MRAFIRSISFSYIGYLLLLTGFALLGLFVAALGLGITAGAWGTGIAMVAAYALAVTAFRFQIRESRDTTSDDPLLVHGDPLMPAVERAEVEWYERTYHHRDLASAA